MNAVTDAEIDALMDEYRAAYDFASEDTDFIETVHYQAREEIAIKRMLDAEGCKAFSNTFQDLYGMRQLPGIASQHLMAPGLWLRRRRGLESCRNDCYNKGNGRGQDRRHRLYGGLHLQPRARGHVQPGCPYAEVCPSVAAARPAWRFTPWASATVSRLPAGV